MAFICLYLGGGSQFDKQSAETTTTQGVPYDYWSVMHYGKDAFSNGNGLTIITKDPKFQDVIGQRLEVSPKDTLELNLLYKCSKCLKVGGDIIMLFAAQQVFKGHFNELNNFTCAFT